MTEEKNKAQIINKIKKLAAQLGFKPIGETNEIFIHKENIFIKITTDTNDISRYSDLFEGD